MIALTSLLLHGCDNALVLSLRFQFTSNPSCHIHRATTTDDVELLRHFIEAGLDINRTGFDHRTALHHAVTEVRLSTVQYLLTIPNINTETKDRWSRTPLDDAEMNLGRAYDRDSERETAARDIVRMLRECVGENANNRVGSIIGIGTGSTKSSLEGDSAIGESP